MIKNNIGRELLGLSSCVAFSGARVQIRTGVYAFFVGIVAITTANADECNFYSE